MLGITCALFDEAYEVIRLLKPVKKDGISHYIGQIGSRQVSLFLTRPKLYKNTKNLTTWLGLYPFSSLIITGFCGSLTNKYAPGDICEITKVYSAATASSFEISTGMPKQKLLTVDHPVLTMDERENVLMKYSVDLVDMETYTLCEIFHRVIPGASFKIIRIVGDVPGEDSLMQNEIKMRSYFSTFSRIEKCKIAWHTGLPFFQIYARKRMLQKALFKAVENQVKLASTEE